MARFKKNVGLLIDGELKEKMTVEAQLIGLKIFDDGGESLVQNFSEIGKVWKHDNSVKTATKINRVLHGQFAEVDGYEYDIERDVMKKCRLEYKDARKGLYCNDGGEAEVRISEDHNETILDNTRSEDSYEEDKERGQGRGNTQAKGERVF